MRRGVFALLGAAFLFTLPLCGVARAVTGCSKPPQDAVTEVTVAEPEVVFDYSRSKVELKRLAVEDYGHAPAKHGSIFGLTVGRIRSELLIHTLIEKRKDGIFCVWPARLVGTVVYEGPITVLVAREYPKGTCQHKAVLDHEMDHVAVFKKALPDYEKRLKKALANALAKGRFPTTGRNRDKASGALNSQFEPAVKRAVAEADAERDRRSARLDTPENYEKTRRRCRSW